MDSLPQQDRKKALRAVAMASLLRFKGEFSEEDIAAQAGFESRLGENKRYSGGRKGRKYLLRAS
jgi:hypothetical protein